MISYLDRSLLGTFHSFTQVEELTGDAFEYFSALILGDMGYESVRVSPKHSDFRADGGIDLYAEHNGEHVVGQCKRHSIKSGRYGYMKFEYVQALGGAMLRAKATEGVFVSTLPFSKTSKEYAEAVNIVLIGPDEIREFVEKNHEKVHEEELDEVYTLHPKSTLRRLFPLLCVLAVAMTMFHWLKL